MFPYGAESFTRFYLLLFWGSYKHSILKEINPKYSSGLMLKLKLHTLATWYEELTHWKDPDAGKDWGQEEKRTREDEMVGWHHQLHGHEFEQVAGVGDGQGRLACCNPWGCKESDMTECLNWLNWLTWCKINLWKFNFLRFCILYLKICWL